MLTVSQIRIAVAIAIAAILGSAILIIAVIASGQTFGQRCAKVYPEESREWVECIYNLKKGLPAY